MAWRAISILMMNCRCKQHCRLYRALFWATLLVYANLGLAQQHDAGKTVMARGSVEAIDNDISRALKRRSVVYNQDLVKTQSASAAQLRMRDGALLALSEDSELAIADYQFDPRTGSGNVKMSLVKGGLRTITGKLLQAGDNYRLATPVASIGVRGTHYEAELIEQDLYLAAWEGTIIVNVTAGPVQPSFTLGPNEAYRYAIVRSSGEVEFLLATPTAFAQGHSNDVGAGNAELALFGSVTASTIVSISAEPIELAALNINQSAPAIYNDRFTGLWVPDTDAVLARTGTVIFDQIVNADISSSVSTVSDFTMSMTVDFNSALIPTGNLSFFDDAGEWFAAFNGAISGDELALSVNFAAHDNNPADGLMNAIFINQAQGLLGQFSLSERFDSNTSASGSFELRQR